jgi:hypothetical protein
VVTGEYPYPPPMPYIQPQPLNLLLEVPNGRADTVDNPSHP